MSHFPRSGRLITKHEGDPAYTRLYALRKQLCADVDAGRIRLDEAIERFEAERERTINERFERLEYHEQG